MSQIISFGYGLVQFDSYKGFAVTFEICTFSNLMVLSLNDSFNYIYMKIFYKEVISVL